jgi:hypothetical protein
MPITADALRLKFAEHQRRARDETTYITWMTTVVPQLEEMAITAAESGKLYLEVETPGDFMFKKWEGQEITAYIESLFPGCIASFRTQVKPDEVNYFLKISWQVLKQGPPTVSVDDAAPVQKPE